jgi:hypothetical protein
VRLSMFRVIYFIFILSLLYTFGSHLRALVDLCIFDISMVASLIM